MYNNNNNMDHHYNTFIQITTKILILYYNNIYIFKNSNKSINNFLYFFYIELTKIFKYYNKIIIFDQTIDILLLLIKYHYNILNLFNQIDNKLYMSSFSQQNAGFFYGEYDSVYTKILNILDIIIDFISIVPTNNIFQPGIIAPFQIFSIISNAMRGDYVLAFYSCLTLIPGIGNVIGAGSKIIYKLINYIIDKIQSSKQIKRLEDLEFGKYIYKLNNYDPTINYVQESLNSIDNEDLLIGN